MVVWVEDHAAYRLLSTIEIPDKLVLNMPTVVASSLFHLETF